MAALNALTITEKFRNEGRLAPDGSSVARDPSIWPEAVAAGDFTVSLVPNDGHLSHRYSRSKPKEVVVSITEPYGDPWFSRRERVIFCIALSRARDNENEVERIRKAVERFNADMNGIARRARWRAFVSRLCWWR